MEGAFPHGVDRALDGGVGRDDHDHRVRIAAADRAEHLEAGPIGEHQVEEHDVEGVGVELREGFRGVGGRHHVVALPFEERLQDIADHLLVVHDEEPQSAAHDAGAASGSVTTASAPPPSRGASRISPPCRRTMSREIARPSPVPPDFLVV